jgi:hypothetical protein
MGFVGKAASLNVLRSFVHPLALQVCDDLAEGLEASGHQLGVKAATGYSLAALLSTKKDPRQSSTFNIL